ncbi:hypothetical protein, partial [Mycolicibacterium mucogenicum]|uniref:hypothetical protein n=1 Tax=Mycolicibacterium mucogenicum TaxID=56689 RepID=UPI001951AA57
MLPAELMLQPLAWSCSSYAIAARINFSDDSTRHCTRIDALSWSNCQYLWIGVFQATSVPV